MQKWAKSKLREKKNHRVVFTQALLDTCMASAAKKARVITLYSLIEQYKIGGALARKLVKKLLEAGSIKPVALGGLMPVYTSAKVSLLLSFELAMRPAIAWLATAFAVPSRLTCIGARLTLSSPSSLPFPGR